VYDELFRRVPHHPQLARKASGTETRSNAERQLRIVAPYLRPETRYMEIGPGDCSLALAAASRVREVVAVDVSDEITKRETFPPNFRLVLTDGTTIPVPEGSVDVAYSSDLIEHLHPEDAAEQTRGVWSALVPGGKYVCVTPNGLGGPWDVSRGFSKVAEGFHLKEYTIADLAHLFKAAGFSRIVLLFGYRGRYLRVPLTLAVWAESLAARLPHSWRQDFAQRHHSVGYIRMVA